jgi:hypothetical protein
MKIRLPGLLLIALLTGCASAPGSISDTGPARHQGRLVLNEALTIPPNAATVRLQYGRIVPMNGVQEQDPFCVFEIDTVAAGEQTVRPGRFAITRIGRSIETIAGLTTLRRVRVGFGDDSGGPSFLYYKTTFQLNDATQPVRALTCMSNQLMPGVSIMRYLTPEEIRQALGGIITLEFPA